MRLTGRRESSNVEDRRGRSGGGVGKSLGIGGIIVVGLITLLMGGDLGDVFNNVSQMGFQETTESTYTPTAEDEELAKFTRQILAGTEDVWTQEFKKMGKTYRAPRLVMFTDAVQSDCGGATSSTGPFYCSADQTVYIDLSFFKNMKRSLGADGDFAYVAESCYICNNHKTNKKIQNPIPMSKGTSFISEIGKYFKNNDATSAMNKIVEITRTLNFSEKRLLS